MGHYQNITGLRLEELSLFDLKKFSEVEVDYDGQCSEGKGFKKTLTAEQARVLASSSAAVSDGKLSRTELEVLADCPRELVITIGQSSDSDSYAYANIVAKVSAYTLVR